MAKKATTKAAKKTAADQTKVNTAPQFDPGAPTEATTVNPGDAV